MRRGGRTDTLHLKRDPATRGLVEVDVLPPDWAVKGLAARGSWTFQKLEAVSDVPFMRPDGSIAQRPGYDEQAAVLFESAPGICFPEVPEAPTHADAVAAVKVLLEPFAEFPFVSPADRSAVLAAILTMLARHLINGPMPLFGFTAPTPGTGKGRLVNVVAMIAIGGPAPCMVQVTNPEEERKRLLALAIEGGPLALIDNVERPLGSDVLAMAITSSVVKDRPLGVTQMVTAPWRTVLLATGNGLQIRGDLGRRTVLVRLDAQCERPEERVFKRPDLLEWVRGRRPDLVASALTILRAYIAAGRPRQAERPFGGFESWDSIVRAALLWCGQPDPLATRTALREQADEDVELLGSLLEAWNQHIGPAPLTLADLIGRAARFPTLQGALAAFGGSDRPLSAARLSYPLRRQTGRIIGGLRLTSSPHMRDGRRWSVEQVREPATSGVSPVVVTEDRHAVSAFLEDTHAGRDDGDDHLVVQKESKE